MCSCVFSQFGITLPPVGHYATGIFFFELDTYRQAKESMKEIATGCQLKVLCWRKPPVDPDAIGAEARKTEPYIRQVGFILPTFLYEYIAVVRHVARRKPSVGR
jgi:glutamate synthase (NADPH/NADH)